MTDYDKQILVIRFSALGDVAMTLPVIYSAATAYPRIRFTMVTRPFFARLFLNRPKNVELLPLNPKDYSGPLGAARMLGRLGKLKPTAVADLHNVLRTWIIDNYFRCRGVKVVMVDKNRSARSRALKERKRQVNFIDRYRDTFARLGLDFSLTFKTIFPSPPTMPIELKQPAVGIAPFARYFNKTYPPKMMRGVVEKLCKNGVNVYLFGGRGEEAATLGRWAAEIAGCVSVAGEFSIEQELALMSGLRLMVSMDSANQHLASLAGTPVLTLWGSTTPECGFMPYGQPDSMSMTADVPCQPCTVAGSPQCARGNLKCMRSLSESAVVTKIMTFLKGNEPH